MDKLLEIRNLNVTYANQEKCVMAVRNANLSVFKGESMGIVGESGSGKSTLAMAILRLLPKKTANVTGEVIFQDKDLLKLSIEKMNAVRWEHLAVVFQKAMNALSPVHRISVQIEDIYRVHRYNASKDEVRKRMTELLRLVNLPERVYNLFPHEMSGGMLQRVAIAISLLHNPQVLILDEATTALDVVTQGQILDEIVRMEASLATTRIMITHDMSVVASSCKHVAVLYAGEIVEVGPVGKVLKNPAHPYTQGLIRSFPTLTGEKKTLEAIPGFLPDLALDIPGCVFASRCPQAMNRCRTHKPKLIEAEKSQVACFLVEGSSS